MRPLDPQPDLVLFDLDDTLCDYAGARVGRLRIAFELAQDEAGVSLTAPLDDIVQESIQIQPHGVDHFPEILAAYGIRDRAAIDRAVGWFIGHRFHGLELFPDAIETLESVRAAKPHRRLGLVTNGPAEVQTAKIELLGLRSYFDFCLISGVFGFWKPDRQIFEEALRLGGAAASRAVMIGDSPEHDMAGAEAAGIPTIWIDHQSRPWPDELQSPTYTVLDLAAVRCLLAPGRSEAGPCGPAYGATASG
jgi:HAD superfamily hydrolase (TIGR01509 family)